LTWPTKNHTIVSSLIGNFSITWLASETAAVSTAIHTVRYINNRRTSLLIGAESKVGSTDSAGSRSSTDSAITNVTDKTASSIS
jgi:hypothetical protein